jgi:hypothetical protein
VRPSAAAPFSEEYRRYWMMRYATQTARMAVHILVAVLLAAATIAASAQVSLPAGKSRPNGLVVVIENKPQESKLNLRALDNPYVSGVALQIRWRDLEPVEGKPDWAKLDELFAAAEAHGKWVQLLTFPGFFSPEWALKGVQTETFPIQYGPGKGTPERLPMPWDEVYLNRWFAFVKLLSDRYGNSPAFRVISAVGPTSVSAEYSLPGKPQDVKIWQTANYTPSKYRAAWRKTFREYAADFPNQYISLSMGSGLNINDRGKLDQRERKQIRQAIIDEGMTALGSRFVLQFSNLDGFPGKGPGPRAVPYVLGYNGRVITGMQLRTSCERNSGDMGAEGNPALALKKSIDIGMQTNSAGQHINYLEIYEPDVLADDLQPVLRNGAALFK